MAGRGVAPPLTTSSQQNKTIDVLVGVNLMREGIDLPQVSLVTIMVSRGDRRSVMCHRD